jgi:hypothetical protein
MAKTAVYSWRVQPEMLATLEAIARRERGSVASLLDRITREWIETHPIDGDGEQARLLAAAEETLGVIRGGDVHRAERARDALRARLARRRRRAA